MRKTIYILSAFVALLFTACDDYLDVTPKDKQTADQLLATKSGYYSALNGIYDGLASDALYGKNLTWYALDIAAQRYNTSNCSYTIQNLAQGNYTYNTVSPLFSDTWQKAYELILADNILLDRIDDNGGVLPESEAKLMKGELLAIRADLHLDMLRLYGPNPAKGDTTMMSIPYNESSQVTTLPLLPFNEVINRILRDLDEAETLLQDDPIVTEGTLMTAPATGESAEWRYRQFRMNYYAVIGLKARANVWAGRYSEALRQAKRLIEDTKAQQTFPVVDANKLLANTSNPDRIFSTEVLCGVYDKDRDEIYDDYFSSTAPQTNRLMPYATFVAGGQYGLFSHLLLGPETGDYRFQSQWEPASGAGQRGYILSKYKPIDKPDPSDENSEYYYSRMIPIIRMQEMYLIAAECEPQTADQVKWYNAERQRRGCVIPESYLSYFVQYFDYGYKNIFLSQEYMREFYGEGQSFFWLKRAVLQPGYYGMVTPYDNGAALSSAQMNVQPALPEGEMK